MAHRRDALPGVIREYLDRCGEAERYVVSWENPTSRDPHEAMWVITFNGVTRQFTVSSFPRVVSHWAHQLYGGAYDVTGMQRELESGLWQADAAARQALQAFLAGLAGGAPEPRR
jgi:hypothetical protein